MSNGLWLDIQRDEEYIKTEAILLSKQSDPTVVIGYVKNEKNWSRGVVKCKWEYTKKQWEISVHGSRNEYDDEKESVNKRSIQLFSISGSSLGSVISVLKDRINEVL